MTLHCCKTGREWPCASEGQARRMAALYGLKDWILLPAGKSVPVIGEQP